MVDIGRPEDVAKAKVLVFGPAGHGKTYFMGTLADDERTSPTLVLDFEGGTQTLAGRDIDVARVRDWADFEEAYEVLADKDGKYRSVAVDSLSEVQVSGLLRILEADKRRADPDQLAQQDWGLILVQMRRFVRSFVHGLDMHVFMSALAKDELDPREGRVVVPAFQGAFATEVAGIFDTVGYMALTEDDDGETERVLLLSHPKYRVKARTPMGQEAPSELFDPSAGRLLDALGYGKARKAK